MSGDGKSRHINAPVIVGDGTIYLYALNGHGSRLADTPWPAVARNNANTGDIRDYLITEPIFSVNNEVIPTSQGTSVSFS